LTKLSLHERAMFAAFMEGVPTMKKLALALATTAILGFAAPAFAADSDMTGSKPQTQSPSGQTSTPSAQTPTPSQTPSAQSQTPSTQTQTPSAQNQTPSMQNKASAQSQVNGKAKSKVSAKASNKAKMAHRRGTNKLARHEGTNRLARHEPGFKRGHYYAYAPKPQHKSLHHHSKTMTHS
jgi:cytoskeletal protein RodZ